VGTVEHTTRDKLQLLQTYHTIGLLIDLHRH